MKAYNRFMILMSSIMVILPRFLELADKTIKTREEEKEFEKMSFEIEALKSEMMKILPEINKALTKEFNEYFKKITKDIDPEEFFTNIKNKDVKQVSNTSLEKFMKLSLN